MNVPLAIAIVVGAAAVAVLLLSVVRRRVGGPLLFEPARGTPMSGAARSFANWVRSAARAG